MVLKSGTCKSSELEQALRQAHRLAQGKINKPLIVRQNWIVASLYIGRHPRLPLALPCQRMSLSSQTSREPCAFTAVL